MSALVRLGQGSTSSSSKGSDESSQANSTKGARKKGAPQINRPIIAIANDAFVLVLLFFVFPLFSLPLDVTTRI